MVSSEAEDGRGGAQDGKQGLLLSEVFVPFPTRPAALPQTWPVGAYLSGPLGFCELPFIMYWGFHRAPPGSLPLLWSYGMWVCILPCLLLLVKYFFFL